MAAMKGGTPAIVLFSAIVTRQFTVVRGSRGEKVKTYSRNKKRVIHELSDVILPSVLSVDSDRRE